MRILPLFVATLMITSGLLLRSAHAGDRETCFDKKVSVEPRISACSRLISSGKLSGRELAQIYYVRANTMVEQGNLDSALDDFNRAVRLYPDGVAFYVNRGALYRRNKEYEKAIADFDQAIRINPRLTVAYLNRAGAHAGMKNYERARADAQTALQLPAYGDNAESSRENARKLLELIDKQIKLIAELENLKRTQELLDAARKATATPEPSAVETSPFVLGRRIALVVGNAAYSNAARLSNPANDARSVATALRRLGFVEVIERVDLGVQQLRDELKSFGDKSVNADWAVVYFAGHGIQVGQTSYLIPTDAKLLRESHVDDEAVALPYLLSKVEDARQLRLVILDACRNNPFLARLQQAGGKRSLGRGLGPIEPQRGVLVAYAARDGQIAEDGTGQHSPFTEALLQYLEEPNIEIELMFRKVRDGVLKRTARTQEPFVYGSLPSEGLYFKRAER